MKRQFYGCPSVWDKPMGHACDVWGDDLTAANSQVANFILGLFENGFFEVSELICCMELRALWAWGRMKWLGLFVLWKKPWGIMGSPQELSIIDWYEAEHDWISKLEEPPELPTVRPDFPETLSREDWPPNGPCLLEAHPMVVSWSSVVVVSQSCFHYYFQIFPENLRSRNPSRKPSSGWFSDPLKSDTHLALGARSYERPLFVAALLVTADLSDADVQMLHFLNVQAPSLCNTWTTHSSRGVLSFRMESFLGEADVLWGQIPHRQLGERELDVGTIHVWEARCVEWSWRGSGERGSELPNMSQHTKA